MKMYKILFIICLLPSVAFGQLCQKYRQEGITAFNNRDYVLALKKFQGASKVSDAAQCTDLGTWIDKTQKALQPKPVITKPKEAGAKSKPEQTTPSVSTPFVAPQMVKVEGGTFQMGQSDPDIICKGCTKSEQPVHAVSVNDFYIGKYEVTQDEWRSVMGKNPKELTDFKGDNMPVHSVSWDDIQDFLQKINIKTGKKYRLPTEAEWEYAARGGNKSSGYTYSGSNDVESVAWMSKNAGSKTHTVGQLKANELGIYDMSGNVWEWCQDWFKGYPGSSGVSDYTGSDRVDRGGGWSLSAGYCRSAYRNSNAPTYRNSSLGFRLAISSL
jgi:formylglycine-generating enzyme required for sulfatase activity